jgi:DNA-binding transcriptional MocR family regulator
MSDYREGAGGSPTLMLGYAAVPEAAIRAGIRELGEAVRAARAQG